MWAGSQLRPIRVTPDTAARDGQGRKCCTSCGEWLAIDRFHGRAVSPDGLCPACKRCTRSHQLQRDFGLTVDEYEEILKSQGGGCAVCGKTEESNGRMLAVDHDHACCPERMTCGRCRRGLLCTRCNLHLGAIGDSIEHIEAMASYLRTTLRR
ncbi:endonuclease VII domain-containing protein [Streptomyces prunicolor]